MDRRTFLKFMGVSSAATAVSTTLAKLPEVQPKIELLSSDLIVPGSPFPVMDFGDVVHFDNVISYKIEIDNNFQDFHSFSGVNKKLPGKRQATATFEVYASPELHFRFLQESYLKVSFGVPELAGKTFIAGSTTLKAYRGEPYTMTIEAFEV